MFKSTSDAFVGRLSYIKVLTGVLEPGQDLVNARTGDKDRVGKLLVMMGKESTEVKSAKAGDIIVVPKLDEARPSDTLSASGKLEIAPIPFPTPLYPVAIEAVNKKEEDKLGTFLAKAAETDPTIQIRRDEETHQTIINAMGDEQINTLLIRMKETANVEAKLIPVRIPYRETIRAKAEAQGRHKKQTGGSGQFGDCWLRLEPNPDMGYEFVDEIKGGAIPGGLIPAVDKGVQDAMAEGCPRRLSDGRHQVRRLRRFVPLRRLQRNGVQDRGAHRLPRLLREGQPRHPRADGRPARHRHRRVRRRRHGRHLHAPWPHRRHGATDLDGETVIIMRAPYAEVVNYTRDLRSMTRGQGSYTIEIDGYEEVPREAAQKIIDAYEAAKEK